MFPFTAASFLALVTFVTVAALTPGPNNAMLMASGANFGMKRTAPHMAGVTLGYGFMLVCIGLGLGAIFTLVPVLHDVLRWAGAAYLLWLAWKIAHSSSIGGKATDKPFTFWQAAAFQWINPKGWMGAVGAVSAYSPKDHYLWGLVIIVLVSQVLTVTSVLVWAGMGAGLRRFLETPGRLRAFNWTMAGLLVLSLIPMLFGEH